MVVMRLAGWFRTVNDGDDAMVKRGNTVQRRLVLDDDDLIMVVNKDVVSQIDENRGEMNRTEFVNFLIHNQLQEYDRDKKYISKEEFYGAVQEIKVLLMDFLDFVLALEPDKRMPESACEGFALKVRAIGGAGSKD